MITAVASVTGPGTCYVYRWFITGRIEESKVVRMTVSLETPSFRSVQIPAKTTGLLCCLNYPPKRLLKCIDFVGKTDSAWPLIHSVLLMKFTSGSVSVTSLVFQIALKAVR